MLTSEILCEPIQVGEDEVILTAEYARVTSSSTPGHWYTVAHGTCDCKGYSFRGTCRHVKAAEVARRQLPPVIIEVPMTAATGHHAFCPGCGQVRWLFNEYGKCALCILSPHHEEIPHAS